jgi:hypothetical protein
MMRAMVNIPTITRGSRSVDDRIKTQLQWTETANGMEVLFQNRKRISFGVIEVQELPRQVALAAPNSEAQLLAALDCDY